MGRSLSRARWFLWQIGDSYRLAITNALSANRRIGNTRALRLEGLARNAGVAESAEPVTIDLTEPEARIIGLGVSR